jgi:hypothetical protein
VWPAAGASVPCGEAGTPAGRRPQAPLDSGHPLSLESLSGVPSRMGASGAAVGPVVQVSHLRWLRLEVVWIDDRTTRQRVAPETRSMSLPARRRSHLVFEGFDPSGETMCVSCVTIPHSAGCPKPIGAGLIGSDR